ncbi:group I truncated hemoglobin [Larkinella soli]|uniref:group I truncated hemoglobin n=1 Tax=Larkinella soli TaxID=1770527 RepID=UPI000FFC1CE8|nr:group 1 truncated hemoglobin [Larkinella soli]
MKRNVFAVLALLAFSLSFTACKDDDDDMAAAPKTLYERLGGKTAISAVVDDFITNVAADPNMKRTFQPLLEDVAKGNTARVTSLRNNLIDQIGQATGGPEMYKGKSMKEAHKGMKITDTEFNSLVADLTKSLDKFKVPTAEKTELLTALAGLKGDIVGQ